MKQNILYFLIFLPVLLNAQVQNSDVSQREFLKINSYPIESVANYYSDLINFSMLTGSGIKGKKFGYIFPDGKIFKSAEYNYASDFKGNYANIIKDSIPGLIFKNGKVKYFPEYDITYWNQDKLGLAIRKNKYGFINTKGKIIVPIIYEDGFPFHDGYASVKKENKWFYIDKNGKEIQSLKESNTSYIPIINNLVLVSDTGKSKQKKGQLTSIATGLAEYLNKVERSDYPENLYDLKSHKMLIFSDYDEISGFFENGLMKVTKNRKVGFVDKNNQIIIPLVYDNAKDISENKIIVKKGGLWGAIDIKNNIIIPITYGYLSSFHENFAFFSKEINGKKIGYINSSNKIIIQPNLEFCWYGNFINGIAVAKKEEKFGFINNAGEFIIPNIYKEAFPFVNGIALVKLEKTEKYTFINQKGEHILNGEFKQLYPLKNNLARFIE